MIQKKKKENKKRKKNLWKHKHIKIAVKMANDPGTPIISPFTSAIFTFNNLLYNIILMFCCIFTTRHLMIHILLCCVKRAFCIYVFSFSLLHTHTHFQFSSFFLCHDALGFSTWARSFSLPYLTAAADVHYSRVSKFQSYPERH